ncbi:MAG: hypothetical protein COW75_08865 [Rhodobacterales bacterium CG18_big_fil_WC_8_21_14_2_50_71_9]|nr:MAG: hypothetical protein COW75_08865 [Rhodobacterales bacterium CG18_big_fil_WC_8_21_14_2_50_71_9]PIY75284.1 MAG: hypothetical protein COY86_00270 [Rhodobacterales bacterium CG_4_10_14_0_8_um_filter_70_9]PJA59695.1 MAG: hypothetical protein CO163_07925 [Rhodobacterales bacterium CG_4_9_14_3_um_filter_71_31]
MSATSIIRQGRGGATASLSGALDNLRARYAAWARRRAAYLQTWRELDGLSDRELSDIGFSRCDIAQIARDAAARV